ncbi:MAG TPA: hypothetical protein VNU95_00070, partial [Candidatus Acidoferrales bacterium]|nr:hypothetical protein [Candidatus Acidoferrales bacterium]
NAFLPVPDSECRAPDATCLTPSGLDCQRSSLRQSVQKSQINRVFPPRRVSRTPIAPVGALSVPTINSPALNPYPAEALAKAGQPTEMILRPFPALSNPAQTHFSADRAPGTADIAWKMWRIGDRRETFFDCE